MEDLPVVPSTFEPSGPPMVRAQCPYCQQEADYGIPLPAPSSAPGPFAVDCENCGKRFRIDPSAITG